MSRGFVFQSFIKGAHIGSLRGEAVEKVHQAEELPQGLDCEGAWKVHDGVHHQRERGGPVFGDAVSEEIDGGQPKLALGRVHNESVPGT